MRIQKIAHKNIPEHHNRKQGNVKRKEKKRKHCSNTLRVFTTYEVRP